MKDSTAIKEHDRSKTSPRVGRREVCQICERPLFDTWRLGGRLCCECGLGDELFHRDQRWTTEPAAVIQKHGTPWKTTMRLVLLRLGLRVLAAIFPAAAEELGARMFFTPRRTPRWTPPALPDLAVSSFSLSLGEDEIACWSWGAGPTVMLVHGWEGYAAQLIHFVDPLLRAGFRVVTFDLPAHGGSRGRRQTSAFDMSRVIRAVAHLFSPTRAVIAHSLGGAATIFAISEGLKVERVVLLAPGAEPKHFAQVLASLLGFSKARAEGMMKRIESRIGMRLQEASTIRRVPQKGIPVLVMHDPHDPDVPFEHGKSIASAWPGAQFEALQDMGHRRMLRDPDTIHSVTAFIANRERGPHASQTGALVGFARDQVAVAHALQDRA